MHTTTSIATRMRVPATTAHDVAAGAAVQATVDAWRTDHHVPGVWVSVRRGGQPLVDVASGVANLRTGRAAATGDRTWAASVTKTMTTAIVLRLAEQGKLRLDDRLATWFPSFPQADAITVGQLLHQDAGIPEMWNAPEVDHAINTPGAARLTAEELRTAIARLPRSAPPGAQWAYSNSNFVLAGAVAERVTGLPIDELLQQELLANAPVAPGSARIDDGHGRAPTSVHTYIRSFGGYDDRTRAFGTNSGFRSVLGAAGGLLTTAPALATLGDAILRPGGAALSDRSRSLMQTGISGPDAYGLGVFGAPIATPGGFRGDLVGHNGAFEAGTGSYLLHIPERDETIALLANTTVTDDEWGELIAGVIDATEHGATAPAASSPPALVV